MGAKGAVGDHLRGDIGDATRSPRAPGNMKDRFLSPFIAPSAATSTTSSAAFDARRTARALAMLRNKHVEMPMKEDDNLARCSDMPKSESSKRGTC